MNHTLVSIIIPAYNSAKYIKKCIESILSQSYENLEILISDDCSTDSTKRLIHQYSDPRIKCYHNSKNEGVVKTRNKLILAATGEFIALQDSDDWSHTKRIELQTAELKKDLELVACGTGFYKAFPNDEIQFSKIFPIEYETIASSIPQEFLLQCPSVMFKSSYIKNNLYSEYFGNSGNEDLYLMGKLILTNKFINVPKPLYYYRFNEQSLTKLGREKDIRRIYIHQITSRLLNDLIKKGTNWIEGNDSNSLMEYESSLKKNIENNPYILFEQNIGQMLYWKQYTSALRIAKNNLIQNGINVKTLRLLLYVCKKALLKK